MAMENEGPKNAGGFQGTQPIDRSASGLQYQSYQMETTARGVNGVARRVAPPASAMFSMSGAQNGGGHAKSTAAAVSSGPEQEY